MLDPKLDRVAVLDFGGQYAHLIANRVRALGVYCVVMAPEDFRAGAGAPAGLILSGGPQSVTDEPRGYAVEHLAQHEAARGGHGDDGLLEVGGAPAGQLLQHRSLEVDPLPEPRIPAADHLVDEPAIGAKIVEVARAA